MFKWPTTNCIPELVILVKEIAKRFEAFILQTNDTEPEEGCIFFCRFYGRIAEAENTHDADTLRAIRDNMEGLQRRYRLCAWSIHCYSFFQFHRGKRFSCIQMDYDVNNFTTNILERLRECVCMSVCVCVCVCVVGGYMQTIDATLEYLAVAGIVNIMFR